MEIVEAMMCERPHSPSVQFKKKDKPKKLKCQRLLMGTPPQKQRFLIILF
jgi:hypothetical protein